MSPEVSLKSHINHLSRGMWMIKWWNLFTSWYLAHYRPV